MQEFFSAQGYKTDIFSCKSAAQDIFFPIYFAAGYFFLPLIITAYSNLRLSYSYRQRRSRGFQSEEAEKCITASKPKTCRDRVEYSKMGEVQYMNDL